MIRWGIIGCGDVTERKSGPGFQNARDSALVAVMRRDGAKAADYAARHGVPRWYDRVEALIHDNEVDAVYIATPPGSHLELARQVAAVGKPALIEKPMARNHEECLAMIQAFRVAGIPLFVAYYRRALPKFIRVKSLLDDGAIGRVLSVAVTLHYKPGQYDRNHLPWRFRREESGGGLFVDLGSHTLDLLDWFFGPIVRAAGFAANQGGQYEVEDAVVLAFEHATGVQGTGSWHFNASRDMDRIMIEGTAGAISVPTFWTDPIQLHRAGHTEYFDIPHPPSIHQPLIQTVVDQLLGRNTCPSTGDSAARTNWVMDQVLATFNR
ncbi:MAG: Gfo/Idh/MocA family oxidoreductase [Phycisphaerae bacterium]|nr:Gfo/Idh/MocA family oxidoreductase [Phycisphaerae bacterium]